MVNVHGPFTTATDGVAAASASRNLPYKVNGELVAIHVTVAGAALTAFSVATNPQAGDPPGAVTLFSIGALAVGNYVFYVRKQAVDSANAAIAGSYVEHPLNDWITISHTTATTATVTVTIKTEE